MASQWDCNARLPKSEPPGSKRGRNHDLGTDPRTATGLLDALALVRAPGIALAPSDSSPGLGCRRFVSRHARGLEHKSADPL
jgi:hypothetical protein